MSKYKIKMEISGPTAMWTRPDTGDSPVSYPAPTYSAVKGIFESILFNQSVAVVPTKVEICTPVVHYSYQTNYGGPLRKPRVIKVNGSYQLLASVLMNPCYRLYADVTPGIAGLNKISKSTKSWLNRTTSPAHAYQDIFNRRLKRGQCFTIPFLGWKEFAPDYVGVFRSETVVERDINLVIPSMLRQVFPHGLASPLDYQYDQNVEIASGVLQFREFLNVK